MKSDDQEAVDLLRQMGRLVIPLLTPEREGSWHGRTASAVNLVLQRLSAEPAPRRLPVRALGTVVAVAASVGLWFGARQLLPAQHAWGDSAGSEVAQVVSVTGDATLTRVSAPPSALVANPAVSAADEVRAGSGIALLGPGEHWSSQTRAGEAEVPAKAPSGSAVPVVGTAAPTVASPARALPVPRPSSTSESTLAEENRLYCQALTHAGDGDLPSAVSELGALIQRYPRSPLAPNARVERFRLLEQSGNGSAAAQEARHYLSEYPNGFARDEARSLALIGRETPE